MGQCIICGKNNQDQQKKCSHCGSELPASVLEPITAPLLSAASNAESSFAFDETLDLPPQASSQYPAVFSKVVKNDFSKSLLSAVATDITLPPQNTEPGMDFALMQAVTSDPPKAQPVVFDFSQKTSPSKEMDESFDDIDFMDLDMVGQSTASDHLLDDSMDLDLDDFDQMSDSGTHVQVNLKKSVLEPLPKIQTPPALPKNFALVLLKKNHQESKQFLFNKSTELVVGRGTVDISLPNDLHLSSRHASFKKNAQNLILEDLKSLNGTWLRLRSSKIMSVGEEFMIGQQMFKIQLSSSAVTDLNKAPNAIKFSKYTLSHIRSDGAQLGLYPLIEGISKIGRYLSDVTFSYDAYMSPAHIAISVKNDMLEVKDLGSQNGTWLRVVQKIELQKNDIIRLGQSLICVL